MYAAGLEDDVRGCGNVDALTDLCAAITDPERVSHGEQFHRSGRRAAPEGLPTADVVLCATCQVAACRTEQLEGHAIM